MDRLKTEKVGVSEQIELLEKRANELVAEAAGLSPKRLQIEKLEARVVPSNIIPPPPGDGNVGWGC